ncbi:hypothetical protein QBC44DRAFT_365637 [Cladorrhinum sp. PSN332]|nr:hypothetical protein QBC44DRAFT_365637 [Cladorrhinum sp. PSN332]
MSSQDRPTPIYDFPSTAVFADIQTKVVELARKNELDEIEEFNGLGKEFWAFPFLLVKGDNFETWVIFVHLRAFSRLSRFPKQGDRCKLRLRFPIKGIVQNDDDNGTQPTETGVSEWYEAARADINAASFGFTHPSWEICPAFRVTAEIGTLQHLEKPTSDIALKLRTGTSPKDAKNILPIKAALQLEPHTATIEAELSALKYLEELTNTRGTYFNIREVAYRYLMHFKTPGFRRSMLVDFPHMADPTKIFNISQNLVQRYIDLDDDQRNAYCELLGNLPCGIGMLPGGPGCGKKMFIHVVAALAQAKPVIFDIGHPGARRRTARVLFLTDIEQSIDRISGRFAKLYSDTGLLRHVVQITSPSRKTRDGRLDFTQGFLEQARLHRRGILEGRYNIVRPTHRALTLDEFVWDHFQRLREYHSFLGKKVDGALMNEDELPRYFVRMVTILYQDVLKTVDTICASPVAVSQGLGTIWKPDIVFFNDSPNVRELSILISIAHFTPRAWIFTGDHRQMQPSADPCHRHIEESWLSSQLQISTMRRAHMLGAVSHELLTSHRAYGNIRQLPSRLFYDSKIKAADYIPDSIAAGILFEKHLRPLLSEKHAHNMGDNRQRVFVQVPSAFEVMGGRSSYRNHDHLEYVVQFIKNLCADPRFTDVKHALPGTVLIIAWDEVLYDRYIEAIHHEKGLSKDQVRVSTADSCRGNVADFVIVDFVRIPDFFITGGRHRLATAMSRARQGELVLIKDAGLDSLFGGDIQSFKTFEEEIGSDGACAIFDEAQPKGDDSSGEEEECSSLGSTCPTCTLA